MKKTGNIKTIFTAVRGRRHLPGCNCAVITKDDKWTCSVGYKQLVPEKEINGLDTIHDLASISKVLVTTTCILKLIEEGTITLKTKIAEILPQFGQKELTIKDCITHSSGLPADINGYKQMKDDAEMIEAVWKMELEYPTGSQVKYSDVNFILLGLVIAQLKGSLDSYAKQVMFEPLEMKETGYQPAASLRSRCCAEEVMESRGGVVRGVVHDGRHSSWAASAVMRVCSRRWRTFHIILRCCSTTAFTTANVFSASARLNCFRNVRLWG